MPESDATDKEQQPPLIEEPWHDKVLGDAIGYTKGLVNVLDSLSEGFRRRGREIEEQRHRLAILQSERRAILEERAGLEAQIGSLAAERDGLGSKLEERDREIAGLRQELSQGHITLEACTREIQDLQAAVQDSNRQAEELREIVRSLERQLLRVRQSPARAPQAQMPGDLVTPERPVEAAPSDLADSSGLAPNVRRLEEAQIDTLAAERDRLQSELEVREWEIDGLRQELFQGQATLEARTREIRKLQVGMTESARQVGQLREIVKALERGRERDAQHHAARVAEIEGEALRVRDTSARASQEQIALRGNLTSAESLVETARRDLAGARKLIAGLRRILDEERSHKALLQKRLRSQVGETARLNATVQDARTLLNEIAGIFGGAPEPAREGGEGGREGGEWSELAELVEGPEKATDQVQEVLTILRPIVVAVQEVLGAADDPTKRPPRVEPEQAPVRLSVQQIADQWRRFQQERGILAGLERQLPEENVRLSAQVAASVGERETQEEGQGPTPTRDRQARMVEAASGHGQGKKGRQPAAAGMKKDLPTPAGPPASPQKVSRRGGPFAGKTVECIPEVSGGEIPRILRGKISRINTMGLMGAFEERLPEGQRVVVRFARDAEEFSSAGRVVRVQQSTTAPDVPVVYHHLIRFDSPMPGFPQQLMGFPT